MFKARPYKDRVWDKELGKFVSNTEAEELKKRRWVPQTDQDLVEAYRAKAQESLYFFISEVCEFGYNPDPSGPRVTEDQKPLCDWLQTALTTDEHWFNLFMTPRDTLKSTVLQLAALWVLMTRNPNARFLFYGEVHEQAQKRIAVIKRVIMDGAIFRLCYGEQNGDSEGLPWNVNMITLRCRKQRAIREASIETAGLDVVVNARHFDFIFIDDIHSEKNTKTKDQIEDVKEKIQLLLPLKSKGGKICMAGVFWNDADAHNWVLDEIKPNFFRRSVYAEDGSLQYPHALPQDELDIRTKSMRSDLFACHYLLDPVSKESQKFRKEDFLTIELEKFGLIRSFMLVDQAGDPTSDKSSRRDSDYTAIAVVGVNHMHDLILLDGFFGRVSPTEAIEDAIRLWMHFKMSIIGIERAGIGNMSFYLREELRKKGIFAFVEDLLPQGRSKYQRVMELEPYVRRRKFYISSKCPQHVAEEFIDEITRFPKAKRDDFVDAVAYIMDLLRIYGVTEEDRGEAPEIAPHLMKLNELSRGHWHNVAKKSERNDRDWVKEFVA